VLIAKNTRGPNRKCGWAATTSLEYHGINQVLIVRRDYSRYFLEVITRCRKQRETTTLNSLVKIMLANNYTDKKVTNHGCRNPRFGSRSRSRASSVVNQRNPYNNSSKDRDTNLNLISLMGDFNAKIGEGKIPGVVVEFGLGVRNDRGERLIQFCIENKLTE